MNGEEEQEQKSPVETGTEVAKKGVEAGKKAAQTGLTVAEAVAPEAAPALEVVKLVISKIDIIIIAFIVLFLIIILLVVVGILAITNHVSSGHFIGSPGAISPYGSVGNAGTVGGVAGERVRCNDQSVMLATYGNSSREVGSQLVYVDFMGKSIRFHRLAAPALEAVARDIRASGVSYNFYDVSTYNWRRNVNASSRLSLHSFGIAIDINPRENPNRRDNVLVTDLPREVIDSFKRHGFFWGGDYRNIKDSMHFEYCIR